MSFDHPNENLIKKVSDRISEVKTESRALFSSIQDRQKGQFIIEYFPWPIGVEIRRLISGDRVVQDQNRLEQLLKLGERAIQFLSFSLICDLWSRKKNSSFEISTDLSHHIAEIDRPSVGTWTALIRACSTIIKHEKEQNFFSKSEIDWKALNDLSVRFVEIRNIKVHHSGELDFNEVEQLICDLLVELCFLTKFNLVTVRDIQVHKTRLSPVNFEHNLAMLNSTHKDFSIERMDAKEFAESQSVLLLSEDNISGSYLNLFPLIIDTKPFLKMDIKSNGVNGIFLYHHRKNDKVTFVGTEPVRNIELTGWNIEAEIIAQLDDLKTSLSHE